MILAIDIGNTTVALAGIKDGRVCFVSHMETLRSATEADYRPRMEKAFSGAKYHPIRFEGVVLSSVVPEITDAVARCAAEYSTTRPLIVSPALKTGLTMAVPEPGKVGRDRIVDAAAAAANYPLPVVTVDMGTATTFNVIDEDKRFLGGLICPGLSTGLRALSERCAQLPQVRLSNPKAAIGTNTGECMVNGAILGAAATIDGIADRVESQLGKPVTVVVTGGLARFVVPHCRREVVYEPELLFKGLAALYAANRPIVHKGEGQASHRRQRRRNPRRP